MKRSHIPFIIICFIILLLPFAGTALVQENDGGSESGEEVVYPSYKEEDGSYKASFLSDCGDFFSSNFAGRQEMVSANAWIYGKIFHTSTTDQVLMGTDDWMYYTASLDDYTSEYVMSQRGINNIIHNLMLIQNYVEDNGSQFYLTIAPNKNSVADEHMPYYYNKTGVPNTYELLEPALEASDVHYINLYDAFRPYGEELWLPQDSHWTNQGAVLAYNTIMDEFGVEHETYETVPYEVRKDDLGDLTEMLYPLNSELEEQQYYQVDWKYEYLTDTKNNMDEWIETSSPKNDTKLLMYRDSFGESMLPFFAEEFGHACFSRLVPYYLGNVTQFQPDYVVMERVERRIPAWAEGAAVVPTPQLSAAECGERVSHIGWEELLQNTPYLIYRDANSAGLSVDGPGEGAMAKVVENGDYYVISGRVDPELMNDNAEIHIGIVDAENKVKAYDTFWVSDSNGDDGFEVYMLKSDLPEQISALEIFVNAQ